MEDKIDKINAYWSILKNILVVIFAILFLIIFYLLSQNGRYQFHHNSGFVLDTHTGKIYSIGDLRKK